MLAMRPRFHKDLDLPALLRAELEKRGETQREWAKRHGISDAYVSDFLLERRKAGPAILRALGFDEAPYFKRLK